MRPMESSTSVSVVVPVAYRALTASCAAFIDALFLCYSALTVTGLSTVNLSTCTVFQQVILYVLQAVGDVVSPAALRRVMLAHENQVHRRLDHGVDTEAVLRPTS